MPEQRLEPLRREALLDRPRCKKMPQGMHPVFRPHNRLPGLVLLFRVGFGDAGRKLERVEAAIRDVGMVLNVAIAIRENEP